MVKNNNGGFTLIEITLSIAMLSIVSIFVINLFIASNKINTRSKESDMSTILISNEFEAISTLDSLEELDEKYTTNKNSFSYKAVYNDTFVISSSGKYTLTIRGTKTGYNLYDITGDFYHEDNIIKTMTTKHYFNKEALLNE